TDGVRAAESGSMMSNQQLSAKAGQLQRRQRTGVYALCALPCKDASRREDSSLDQPAARDCGGSLTLTRKQNLPVPYLLTSSGIWIANARIFAEGADFRIQAIDGVTVDPSGTERRPIAMTLSGRSLRANPRGPYLREVLEDGVRRYVKAYWYGSLIERAGFMEVSIGEQVELLHLALPR
ncbi:MAG: hypothetical protein ACYDG3_10770, partial [Bacillati bacterium]